MSHEPSGSIGDLWKRQGPEYTRPASALPSPAAPSALAAACRGAPFSGILLW